MALFSSHSTILSRASAVFLGGSLPSMFWPCSGTTAYSQAFITGFTGKLLVFNLKMHRLPSLEAQSMGHGVVVQSGAIFTYSPAARSTTDDSQRLHSTDIALQIQRSNATRRADRRQTDRESPADNCQNVVLTAGRRPFVLFGQTHCLPTFTAGPAYVALRASLPLVDSFIDSLSVSVCRRALTAYLPACNCRDTQG
ncbi:hypothetical protein BKA80DRAFT_258898 [Phyllosticta citrichinensis]